MLKNIILLIFTILLFGCATANSVPEEGGIPNKFDGRWEFDSSGTFYMYFDIKYGKIVGRLGKTVWPLDYYLPIRGKVSPDGEFKFKYAAHPDISNAFELEVTEASAEKGFIRGFATDDLNRRSPWEVFRK